MMPLKSSTLLPKKREDFAIAVSRSDSRNIAKASGMPSNQSSASCQCIIT